MGRLCATTILGLMCCVSPCEADEMRRVRGTDGKAERLIRLALDHSPTAAALVRRIEATDVIVYVRLGPLASRTAQTSLMTVTPERRFLLVTIHCTGAPGTLVELLGHELQHVVEIAEAPEVRNSAGMRDLYASIGRHGARENAFETLLAQVMGTQVRREFLSAARSLGSLAGL